MYTSVDFNSNHFAEGGPLSHKQGVSYTNLVFGLVMTLKLVEEE